MPQRAPRRAILVFGASGTLGSAIVARLKSENPAPLVAGTYHRNRARLLKSADFWRCLDASDEAQMNALWHELARTLRREKAILSDVVWAIGTARDGLLMRTSRANWEHSQSVNLDGAFLAMRSALRYLPRGGRIVLLASRVGESGGVGQSAYAANKAALVALARCAARESGEREIAVNVICPGFVSSAMTQNLSEITLRQQRKRDAFGELGRAESTANVVSWLLSAESRGVSGQVFHADARLNG